MNNSVLLLILILDFISPLHYNLMFNKMLLYSCMLDHESNKHLLSIDFMHITNICVIAVLFV